MLLNFGKRDRWLVTIMLGKDREVMARLSRLMVSRQGVLGGPGGGQVLVRLITTGILFWLESGICVKGVTLLCQ